MKKSKQQEELENDLEEDLEDEEENEVNEEEETKEEVVEDVPEEVKEGLVLQTAPSQYAILDKKTNEVIIVADSVENFNTQISLLTLQYAREAALNSKEALAYAKEALTYAKEAVENTK